MTRDEAYRHALAYLGVKVIGFDVTREALRHHASEGFAAPGEPGYDLGHGRITVPACHREETRHTFSTDDLFDELRGGRRTALW